jgi:tRNA U34 5-methylaminomethyl-2-thiouridine-forming methyltransferase MnmC
MKLMQLVLTNDGSHTIYLPELDESYHSMHGAVTESKHVFIKAGLNACKLTSLNIFEMGFGTGLNALLTWLECRRQGKKVYYRTIENNPLKNDVIKRLNYVEILGLTHEDKSVFRYMHDAPWAEDFEIDKHFVLHKFHGNLNDCILPGKIDLVYFDAFSPDRQPDVWKYAIFERLFRAMNAGAILTTYCSKGKVRRTLDAVGFKTEVLPGAPGKREMMRALKASSPGSE